MQSRSIRPAGQPTCAKAFLNARCWSGPDPRRALWPAVMGTASKGRTHGCTDQCCKTVKKALAKPEPSTHGTFRTSQPDSGMSAGGGRAEVVIASPDFRVWTHNGHPACMGNLRSSNVLCPELELL